MGFVFRNKFIKILTFASVAIAFFVFAPSSADAACGVVGGGATRWRIEGATGNPSLVLSEIDQDQPFNIYLDVQLSGDCLNESIVLNMGGLTDGGGLHEFDNFTNLNIDIQYVIGQIGISEDEFDNKFSMLLKAGEEGCYVFNDPKDCWVVAQFFDSEGEFSRSIGSAGYEIPFVGVGPVSTFLSSLQSENPSLFNEIPTIGDDPILLSPEDGSSYTELGGMTDDDTTFWLKVFNFSDNDTDTINYFAPGLSYDCDGNFCLDGAWSLEEYLAYGEDSDEYSTILNPAENQIFDDTYAPLAPIPGVTTDNLTFNELLPALVEFLIIIAGIAAVVMIVLGGIQYMTTDAISGKEEGKDKLKNALLGLVLALGAWLILNTINPNFTENFGLNIPKVTLEGDANYFSSSSTSFGDGIITAATLPTDLGLFCPGSGGSAVVPEIVGTFDGKVTYRWGGKGGDLPDGEQFPLSPGEQANGPYQCGNEECRSFCPEGSVCLDCSGFVNHVRQCAGLPTYTGTSSMVSSPDAISIDPSNISANGQTVLIGEENYNLQPGDIFVWDGHVVIYSGLGQIAESRGSLQGIQQANFNIVQHSLVSYDKKNEITHLIKVNP